MCSDSTCEMHRNSLLRARHHGSSHARACEAGHSAHGQLRDDAVVNPPLPSGAGVLITQIGGADRKPVARELRPEELVEGPHSPREVHKAVARRKGRILRSEVASVHHVEALERLTRLF